MINKVGILLTNTGTPAHPTPFSVAHFLKKFLTDPRVIEIPKICWLPILYGLILPIRAFQSARAYQKIWTSTGSPLLTYSLQIAQQLEQRLQLPVALGMHYSNPSIKQALAKLQKNKVDKIIVLPLYPQYSATTTAATFDQVSAALRHFRKIPAIHFITDYADNPFYINAIVQSIRAVQSHHGKPQKILFSFHGIPKRYVAAGDPYEERCQTTVALIAKELGLTPEDYLLTFQSRLGGAEWLQPYTHEILSTLPRKRIDNIQVVCPGFAVDCLETLEEIAITGKQQFLQAGGKFFHYISALNATTEHIIALENIFKKTSF